MLSRGNDKIKFHFEVLINERCYCCVYSSVAVKYLHLLLSMSACKEMTRMGKGKEGWMDGRSREVL